MTDDARKKMKQAAQEIDTGLNSLFGALGEAIGEMVSRLEDGKTGAVTRDHVIDTDKGPVRAQAGIRIQMGGLDGARTNTQVDASRPINPTREPPPQQQPAQTRALEYDLFEESEAWVFTADLPGVSSDELVLTRDREHLTLSTTGRRKFQARVDLGQSFDVDGIDTRLRNGVLTLIIPKGSTT